MTTEVTAAMTEAPWLAALERQAPDVVAAYRGIDQARFVTARREVRRRAGPGSAGRVTIQLAAIADAFAVVVGRLPEAAFREPGGEGDWNVAQAIGHVAQSRAGLALAASLAAQGRFPPDAPRVVPGIPGEADEPRKALLARIERSQRLVDRAATRIEGHESDPCPLDHPQVGTLRCGEWLLFAGVHDLQHLAQLHAIGRRLGSSEAPAVDTPGLPQP
jgi:uncharacterized damage-inducible protein DinB